MENPSSQFEDAAEINQQSHQLTIPETGNLLEAPHIPGLTDGIPQEVLNSSWRRAIALLKQDPTNKYALFNDNASPYVTPLLSFGRPDKSEVFIAQTEEELAEQIVISYQHVETILLDDNNKGSIEQKRAFFKTIFPPQLSDKEGSQSVFKFWLTKYVDHTGDYKIVNNYDSSASTGELEIKAFDTGIDLNIQAILNSLEDCKKLAINYGFDNRKTILLADVATMHRYIESLKRGITTNEKVSVDNNPLLRMMNICDDIITSKTYSLKEIALIYYAIDELKDEHIGDEKVEKIAKMLGLDAHKFKNALYLFRCDLLRKDDEPIKGVNSLTAEVNSTEYSLPRIIKGKDAHKVLEAIRLQFPNSPTVVHQEKLVSKTLQSSLTGVRKRSKVNKLRKNKRKKSRNERVVDNYYKCIWELILEDKTGDSLLATINLYGQDIWFREFIYKTLNKDPNLEKFLANFTIGCLMQVKILAFKILADYLAVNNERLSAVIDAIFKNNEDIMSDAHNDCVKLLIITSTNKKMYKGEFTDSLTYRLGQVVKTSPYRKYFGKNLSFNELFSKAQKLPLFKNMNLYDLDTESELLSVLFTLKDSLDENELSHIRGSFLPSEETEVLLSEKVDVEVLSTSISARRELLSRGFEVRIPENKIIISCKLVKDKINIIVYYRDDDSLILSEICTLDGKLNFRKCLKELKDEKDKLRKIISWALKSSLPGLDSRLNSEEEAIPDTFSNLSSTEIPTLKAAPSIDLSELEQDLNVPTPTESTDGSVHTYDDEKESAMASLNIKIDELFKQLQEETTKMLLRISDDRIEEVDFTKLFLFKKVSGKYIRLAKEEILTLLRNNQHDQIFLMKRKSHLRLQGYAKKPRKPKKGKFTKLTKHTFTGDAKKAYKRHIEAGLPDMGNLVDHRFERAILRDYEQGQVTKGTRVVRREDTGDVLIQSRYTRAETLPEKNAVLLKRLLDNNGQEIKLWAARQRENLIADIEAVTESNSDEGVKILEISRLQGKIDNLQNLAEAMISNSDMRALSLNADKLIGFKKLLGKEIDSITTSDQPEEMKSSEIQKRKHLMAKIDQKLLGVVIDKDETGGLITQVKGKIQFGLGWVPAETTFVQGTFENLEAFLETQNAQQLASRKKCPINLSSVNNTAESSKVREITSVARLQRRHEKAAKAIDDLEESAKKEMDEIKKKEILNTAKDKKRKIKIANAAHCKLLCDIVELALPHSDYIFEKDRDFDLLTVKGESALLWELKSINTTRENEREQIQNAIGKLTMYEASSIESDENFRPLVGNITKVILFQCKPKLPNGLQIIVKNLEAKNNVFFAWIKDGKLYGSEKALDKIRGFVAL